MARLRPGQLLRSRGPALALLGALAAASFAGPAAPDEGPVFFRDPDPLTARQIEEAIGLIERPSASDHERGREALAAIGYWAVEPLRALLKAGDAAQRRNAALVLGTIRDRRALPDLVRGATSDPHQYVVSFAALVLGKYQDPSVLDRLRSFVRGTQNAHRRRASVLAVAKIRDPAVFDLLAALVANPREDGLVRETAAFCLGFFRDQALVRGDEGRLVPCRALETALASSDTNLRRAGLLGLALLSHRDLKDRYLRVAADPREDHAIRRIALLALGRFPDEDVTRLFLAVVSDPVTAETVASMAALLLKDRRDPAVLEALLRASPEDPKLKAALTLALANFETPAAVEKVAVRLTDKSDQVRAAAAIGLAGLTVPALKETAIARLTEMLKAGGLHQDVRLNCERAREILRSGEAPGQFMFLGNEEFADALPKDVEERVLDFVNSEVDRVLDLANLSQIKADTPRGERFRVSDEASELRDLKDYLARYPYFEPFDIPEPRVVVTPRPGADGGR